MVMKVLKDRVLVKRDPKEEKTAGGIILPDQLKKKCLRGTVMSIGSQVTDIQVGDVVMYSEFAGTEYKLNGEDMLLMKENDILGVIDVE